MRMHVPLAKSQPWVLPMTIVCLALGALVATLFSAATHDDTLDTSQMNREQLAVLYAQAMKEINVQQQELDALRVKQDELTNGAFSEQKMKEALQHQLDELRVRSGTTPVEGPGIVITIDDTGNTKNDPVNDASANLRVVHDSDLLTLVNELRSAGAEAIDINEQRVAANTAIRCAGSVIQVNFKSVAPPFIITAIGKPDTLSGAVNMPNGVFDWLRPLGIRVDVAKREKIRIDALKSMPPLEYAKPVAEEKTDAVQ